LFSSAGVGLPKARSGPAAAGGSSHQLRARKHSRLAGLRELQHSATEQPSPTSETEVCAGALLNYRRGACSCPRSSLQAPLHPSILHEGPRTLSLLSPLSSAWPSRYPPRPSSAQATARPLPSTCLPRRTASRRRLPIPTYRPCLPLTSSRRRVPSLRHLPSFHLLRLSQSASRRQVRSSARHGPLPRYTRTFPAHRLTINHGDPPPARRACLSPRFSSNHHLVHKR
jgi:hypothetical protein